MTFLIVLPIFLPWLASIIASQSKIITEKRLKPFVAAVVITNFVVLFTVVSVFPKVRFHLLMVNRFIDIYLRPDSLGILFAVLASLLWVFTTFYSFEYMKHENRVRQFFVFFLFTLGVTIGIAFSGNLFTLYIFYELLTLATFPLVIHAGSDEALASGKKYIIYSFSGATLVLLGMLLVFSVTNDLSFMPGGIVTAGHISGSDHNQFIMLLGGYMSLFLGFGVKAALAPFHSWLPNAMVAPTPVSALLHAVAVVKSGIFSLMRTTYFLFGPVSVAMLGASNYLLPIIVLTIVMGSLMALHQDNLKKRLAYSTISQLGYIILGISLLNQDAFIGALLHLINHAVIKITLFFIAGAIYYQTGFKYVHQLDGIGKRMKVTMFCFGLSVISLIGIPPTNGFVSKWYLALGALKAHNVLYAVALLLSAFLTAAYLLPIAVQAFFSKKETPELDAIGEGKSLDPSDTMLIPIFLLTAIVILLGILPNPIINIVTRIAGEVF